MTMVNDHGKVPLMQTMSISEFKATCLAVIERVRRSGEPVLITKRGRPVAEVVPASQSGDGKRTLGSMAGTARIVSDIVAPATSESEWRALTK